MALTSRQFVATWLSKKKIYVDERGSLVSPKGDDYFQIFDMMWLDYCEQGKIEALEQGKKPFLESETNMKKALDELIKNEVQERRQVIIKALVCDSESDDLLKKYVLALTGREYPLVISVMSHWLWQVKRKLNNLPVVHQIMPILYGPQGAGKSVALQQLLSPIANLTLELSLTEVTDARFYFSLNSNFVVILDEMAGANRADVEALKKQITANYNDARKLGTNTVIKIKQNTSLIGTTNRPVGELIYDTTGARRFFQIEIPPKVDWESINGLDYTALLKGINEKRARGYLEPHLIELTKAQESLVGKDEIAAFLEFYQIDPKAEGTKEVTTGDFYALYQSWCETNGIHKPNNSIWFGRRVSDRGIKGATKTIGGKTHRVYLVSKESTIHNKIFDSLDAAPTSIRKGMA